MNRLSKRWGLLGYVLALLAIAAVVIGIVGIAAAMWWGWLVLIVGVVLLATSGGLMATVSSSRGRSRYRDRTQRDPIMETVTSAEESDYVERYRDETPTDNSESRGAQ